MPEPRTLHPPNSAGPATRAYINHGRWIVECQCREAHEARPGLKQWVCKMNVARDGEELSWVGCGTEYAVLWPAPKLRGQIEAVLAPRPRELRNWWPWETLDQLIAENLEHGVAVPRDVLPGGGSS